MSLLFENISRVQEEILNFLETKSIQNWNTLKLVEKILAKYIIVDVESDISIFFTQYEVALNLFAKNRNFKKAQEAKRRLPAINNLMKSTYVANYFRSQLTKNNQATALEQLNRKIQQQRFSKRQCEQSLPKNLKKTKLPAESTSQSLKNLGPEEVLKCIITSKDCKDNVVDFTKPISKKFKPLIPRIIIHYKFSLASAITLEERRVLIDLSLCRTTDDEEKLLGLLFKKSGISENIKYLRTAINGLFDIWRSKRLNESNDEGWLRSNLYSFIWDRAFLFDETFYVKRAECYSAVIRKLKENNENVAQQRVDFILRSNYDGTDYLTVEEKPTEKGVLQDFEKGKKMQQHMLKLWSNWLGSMELVGELEAITCQWQERKLTVFGTRILSTGNFIVYKKATAKIPPSSTNYASAARLFQIILSVKRLVTLNHMKLIAMIEVIEKYSNVNLDLSVSADQPYITYYGSSPESINSSEEEEPEYVEEALRQARALGHPENVLGKGDWEELIIDDVNKDI